MGSETKAPGYGHGGLTHSGRFAITDRRNHRTAFASLEWAVVKELHEEGFAWGVYFDPPDLHHFQL